MTPQLGPPSTELKRLASKLYDDRRRREQLFDSALFGEPAWDMLLALFSEDTNGGDADVAWLARKATVPQSTAIRWQWVLIEEGLIEFGPRVAAISTRLVQLTMKGRKVMERFLLESYPSEQSAARACERNSN